MIPKIVHYCWFGKGKMPDLAIKCLASWKKLLPDYELYLWNEDNFDINQVPYVQEAYAVRKYAFVTDYVRLYALYHHGGVYMDTDVEVLKNLDELLCLPAFSGFESETEIQTAIIGSEKNGKWVNEILNSYASKNFLKSDGNLDLTTNVEIISAIMEQEGFKLQNSFQVYKNCMHIFPKDYFCPKTRSGAINLTTNTYCIHHFDGSWQPIRLRIKKYFFRTIIGPKLTDILVQMKKRLLK